MFSSYKMHKSKIVQMVLIELLLFVLWFILFMKFSFWLYESGSFVRHNLFILVLLLSLMYFILLMPKYFIDDKLANIETEISDDKIVIKKLIMPNEEYEWGKIDKVELYMAKELLSKKKRKRIKIYYQHESRLRNRNVQREIAYPVEDIKNVDGLIEDIKNMCLKSGTPFADNIRGSNKV